MKIIIILWGLFLLCGTMPVLGQTFAFDGNRKKESMNFILIKNLIIIPLYVNGKGPYNFILDTGVSPLIITDTTVMDTTRLNNLRSTKLSGLGAGNDVEAYLTNQIHVRVGSATINHIPAAILKKDIFNLSDYVGIRISGLIGYYFFNSFTVKIRYPGKRLVYSIPTLKVKKKGEKIPLEMISNKPYVQMLVSIDGENKMPVKMIVDIGASHAVSLESLHKKPFPLPQKTIKASLGVGFAGHISGHIGRLGSVEIGSKKFKSVLSSFPDFKQAGAKAGVSNRNGNVGSNLLKHFDLTIDYPNSAMYLKPNSNSRAFFEHDMSGLEIYMHEGTPDLYYVGRIDPESPAEEAGILTDDLILSINFKPITDYKLDDVDAALKAGDGRRVILQLVRKDKMLYKVLILKRRI